MCDKIFLCVVVVGFAIVPSLTLASLVQRIADSCARICY